MAGASPGIHACLAGKRMLAINGRMGVEGGMRWPRAVAFILPNEFGERFSFIGTRVLLNQYLKAGFGLDQETAKVYVHLVNAAMYMFPLLGGAISDSFLGKYRTVVVFSSVNLVGNALLSLFAVNGLAGDFGRFPQWAFLVPVALVAVGSGCAKPCIVSHAGDQFEAGVKLDKFYVVFTMLMNSGILLAVVLMPYIRGTVECFGAACYPLAYAIPTAALLFSLAAFIGGKGVYRVLPPQGEFLPWEVTKLVAYASWRWCLGHRAESWLALAGDSYAADLVQEARQLLGVLAMFGPLVFAWMLHEQNSTEWQNQYEMMDKRVFGVNVPTEACSVYGSFLILALIPLLGLVVFPALERRRICVGAGMRVAIGYLLTVVSFVTSTSLQYWVVLHAKNQVIENNVTVSCEGCVNGAWQLPQWFLFSLGEAALVPSAMNFAYTNVGPKMKASAISILLVSIALGNYAVVALEPALSFLDNHILKQWCYILISTFFLVVYIFLLKFWFPQR